MPVWGTQNPAIHHATAESPNPHHLLIEYLKICRIDHWLKNIFIVLGHAVALVLFFDLDLGTVDSDTAAIINRCNA